MTSANRIGDSRCALKGRGGGGNISYRSAIPASRTAARALRRRDPSAHSDDLAAKNMSLNR